MEKFYLILTIILFALAVSDLIVGVSNDAVNFLNSAIGSKAAPRWIILFVASLGILIGATFSSGMMEVARKGIFHPDMFVFAEIVVIFLAVMITDVMLLDMFNTFSMPTSTTVSIVFELLGSAVAVSLIKIYRVNGAIFELSKYINSAKALAIISGIMVSVVIAFTVGAIIQYITRFIFSFRYQASMKYLGSVFGGFAIAAITYFILIKGMGGSSFADYKVSGGVALKDWVIHHTGMLLLYSFIGWAILIQLLTWLFKIDILQIIVLVGTFALAMAFAGNDLVNFIGVPIAGFKSFQAWSASGQPAASYSMEILKGNVDTPTYMLVIAGLVMIVTMIFSKKAKSVVTTTVDLARQAEGSERFGSSLIARLIVRSSVNVNKGIVKILPAPVNRFIEKQFTPVPLSPQDHNETPSFDKIRAVVNLVVASILISAGTSLKLPLSTTYVTFMVAMGTSLSDRAWDRESAVYRISGVFAVIGGWFLTAFIAFTVSAIVASLIMTGGKTIIFVFIAIAILMVARTHVFFNKRLAQKALEDDGIISEVDPVDKAMEKSRKQVESAILTSNKIYTLCIDSFLKEKRGHLKKGIELNVEFNRKSKKLKNKVLGIISKLQKDDVDSGHFYVQVVDYQRELAHSLNFTVEPLFEHIKNQHKPFIHQQIEELKELSSNIDEFFNFALHLVKEDKFELIDELIGKRDILMENLSGFEKAQIKRIKAQQVNTRNSLLYFNIISETKNMLLHSINLIKSQRDFVRSTMEMVK